MQTASRNVGPVDVEDEYGATRTVQPVVQPQTKRGQVIPEGATRRPMVSRTVDARDAERRTALKRFFRLAAQEGLDTSDAHRMRQALGFFLGRPVYSRRELSAGQWSECEAALWCGLLAW
jgi:hypothetical protein